VISYETLEPVFLNRCGVRLAHFEAAPKAPQSPPLVLVNGWTGDHGIFTPQIAHFGQTRRVVAVDLRGHGASDAPEQEYTMAGFADDIAWQCAQLELQKPIVIGHSFGGAVVLELCGRYSEIRLRHGDDRLDCDGARRFAGLPRPATVAGRHRRAELPGGIESQRMGDRFAISTIRRGER